jgi:predicted solute-binding protein
VDAIVGEWAPRLNLPEQDVKNYLTKNIYYDLDRHCLDGLSLFYQHAGQCDLLPSPGELRFLEAEKLAAI